jgi:hypothetical protein
MSKLAAASDVLLCRDFEGIYSELRLHMSEAAGIALSNACATMVQRAKAKSEFCIQAINGLM